MESPEQAPTRSSLAQVKLLHSTIGNYFYLKPQTAYTHYYQQYTDCNNQLIRIHPALFQ